MNKQPLLEVGKIYVNDLPSAKLCFYVADSKINEFNIWYFILAVNNLNGLENSYHDCCGYMHETMSKYKAQWDLFAIHKDFIREATDAEQLEFATNMRSTSIRKKLGLPPHINYMTSNRSEF